MKNLSTFFIATPVLLLSGVVALVVGVNTWASDNVSTHDYQTRHYYNMNGELEGTIYADPDGLGPHNFPAERRSYDDQTGLLERIEEGEVVSYRDQSLSPSDWGSAFTVERTTEFEYDSVGRLKAEVVIGSDGEKEQLTQYSYYQHDQVKCKTVRMNPSTYSDLPGACSLGSSGEYGQDRITKYEYNSRNQVEKEYRAIGTDLAQLYRENIYDNGRLKGVKDAKGNYTEYRYDAHNRLKKEVFPSKSDTGSVNESDYVQYEYDLNGNVLEERTRNGDVLEYSYDNLNRKVRKIRPDDSGKSITYTYDLRGLQTKADTDHWTQGMVLNTFNGFGELEVQITSAYPNNYTFNYEYDKNGNRESIVYPDGTPFYYEYDYLNRNTVISDGTTNLIRFKYDELSNMTKIIRSNEAVTSYYYDNIGRLDRIHESSVGYMGYEDNDNLRYSHNPANQIIEVTVDDATYHPDKRAHVEDSYSPANGLNQYASVGDNSLEYDDAGNLTEDGSTSYGYDAENRLVDYKKRGEDGFFGYDPLGRLLYASEPEGTTYFAYDGDALAVEKVAGSSDKKYVHGPGTDQPLIVFSGTGADYPTFLHSNHQGSIVARSTSYGLSYFKNTYDPYGVPGDNNDDYIGRFGYTGQVYLDGVELNYYKARFYDPELGRFLQTDPIGYEDQMNLYAYVGNDPVNMTDPTGMYGRGDGWSDEEWKKFNAAQKEAAEAMSETAGDLRSEAKGLDEGEVNGDGFSASELGSMAGSLEKGAAALSDDGSGGYIADAGSLDGSHDFMEAEIGGKSITVDTSHYSFQSSSSTIFQAGHESLHNAGLYDQKLRGHKAYRSGREFSQRRAYKKLPRSQRIKNPDHIMSIVYP